MKKFVMVFPGQGSQFIGMLATFADGEPVIRDVFKQASQVLDYDLWQLTQQGPQQQLDDTEYAQPALLTVGYAVWQAWYKANGRQPDFMAGHSLGEYTALTCAGSIAFTDAVKLVALRGQYMKAASPAGVGAMAAIIGMLPEQVTKVCKQASNDKEQVIPANYNAIGQLVISGHTNAVDKAIELAKQAGAKLVKRLAVSVPSHSSLMQPAADNMAKVLEDIQITMPAIPVINNVDVQIATEPKQIRSALVRQLYSSVRWVETIQYLAKQGVELLIECGPNQVLSKLVKRIDRSMQSLSVQTPTELELALSKVAD